MSHTCKNNNNSILYLDDLMIIGSIGVINGLQERPRIFMGFQGFKHWRTESRTDINPSDCKFTSTRFKPSNGIYYGKGRCKIFGNNVTDPDIGSKNVQK